MSKSTTPLSRSHQVARSHQARGFTLVELLVVIGIIAVLLSILLPTMSRARDTARFTQCRSNLNQIGIAVRMYANDYKDRWPGATTWGGHITPADIADQKEFAQARGNGQFRVGPGRIAKDENGDVIPGSTPEVYGLPSLLHGIVPPGPGQPAIDFSQGLSGPDLPRKPKYLPGDSKVWICPSQLDWMSEQGNTYTLLAYSGRDERFTSKQRAKLDAADAQPIAYIADNYTLRYAVSGSRPADTNSSTLPQARRFFPHTWAVNRRIRSQSTNPLARDTPIQGAINTFFRDGSVGIWLFVQNGNASRNEYIRG
jgi:prepilin-type N-terminal cleavage/methylation domain-containing protein